MDDDVFLRHTRVRNAVGLQLRTEFSESCAAQATRPAPTRPFIDKIQKNNHRHNVVASLRLPARRLLPSSALPHKLEREDRCQFILIIF